MAEIGAWTVRESQNGDFRIKETFIEAHGNLVPVSLPNNTYKVQSLKMRDWRSSWVDPIFSEFYRACEAPGWNPKIVNLSDDLHMIHLWGNRAGIVRIPVGIHAVELVDHPILKELPANAPRAVKSLYKKEVRISHTRGGDYWNRTLSQRRAQTAWAKYLVGGSGMREISEFIEKYPFLEVIISDEDMTVTSTGAQHRQTEDAI